MEVFDLIRKRKLYAALVEHLTLLMQLGTEVSWCVLLAGGNQLVSGNVLLLVTSLSELASVYECQVK